MEKIADMDYYREDPDLIYLQIITDDYKYELNGFEPMFLRQFDEVLRSDFEDNEVYFRDQPHQKLIVSKTGEGVLELSLSHTNSQKDDIEMKVEKEKFKNFLKKVKEDLSG